MRALLVQGISPPAYWGYRHSLPFIGKAATHPPLGLATLAAHLPPSWELQIKDLHLGPVSDEELRAADAVLVSGMLVQAPSMHETLARAARLGKITVAGGPAPTTSPGAFPDARFIFQGEAEGRVDRLVDVLEHPGAMWRIGIRGEPERRRWFWRLLRIGMGQGTAAVARAVEFSIVGEHFIRYTAEDVLPRLEADVRPFDRPALLRARAHACVARPLDRPAPLPPRARCPAKCHEREQCSQSGGPPGGRIYPDANAVNSQP